MNSDFDRVAVGYEQPIALKKIYFGVVCAFCILIAAMIFDPDNYETWVIIPMLMAMITYHYFLTLNVSNVYKCGGDIIIENAIRGDFTISKQELVDVKTNLFVNKIFFTDTTFYFLHSAGFLKSLLLGTERDYEKQIKQLLLD